MKLKELILNHVGADGPVSFDNILNYVQIQSTEKCDDVRLSIAINSLIRNRKIELYDNGVSFVTCRLPVTI